VAQAVIDHLEVVKIDEQHRDPAGAGLDGERVPESLDEPDAVW